MKTNERIKQPQHATPINWGEVHRRLEIGRAALARDWEPPVEKKKEILTTRAKALAKEGKEKEELEEHIEIVEFLLANEQYGIETSFVREVYPLRELTPLPCVPPFVLGIINVRGKILSILDIKKFFDLPEKGLGDLNKVIILHSDKPALSEAKEMEFGILADVILGTRSIPANEIQLALPTLTGIRAEYLKGVAKDRLVILDGEKLLLHKKLIVHEEVT